MACSGANAAAAHNDRAGRARWRQTRLRARTAARRVGRRLRRLAAVVVASALTGSVLAPVAAVAGGAAAVTAAAIVSTRTPAKASISGSVLILSTSVNGGSASAEAQAATGLGLTVTVATPATWDAMTQAQFKAYNAIIIGDPSTTSCASTAPTDAVSTAGTWGPAISGHVAVLGTAPALGGATALIRDAISYAADEKDSNGTPITGLYVSLNCYYSTQPANTGVSLLGSVDGGGFTVTGQGSHCPSAAGTVNTWQALALAEFNGLTTANLGPWSSPACSVEETLNSWPAGLNGVGYYTGASPATFTASDGATGQAYILAGVPLSTPTAALAASTGGEVPLGATAGGSSNPAAPGVNQPSASGVNSENGDFTQSATDLSIPTYGPSLDFSRSYDAQAAQTQTRIGTPGPMGYGWTDNWATSLATLRPTPHSIYTLDGLRNNNGDGGAPTSGVLDTPGEMIQNSGNIYIADTAGNRILEIPGASGTQWGQSMTAGDVYTIAGSPAGAAGVSPQGTPMGQTLLNAPSGIEVNSGNLYIADTNNDQVLEIPGTSGTFWGVPMTANDSYTIAGFPTQAGVGRDNELATQSHLDAPTQVLIHNGDLYIADSVNNRIQEISAAGGAAQWGQSGTWTANFVYTVAGDSGGGAGDSASGGAASSSLLRVPQGIKFSGPGDLYIADTGNHRVKMVAAASGSQWGTSMTANHIYDIVGTGTAGTANGALGSAQLHSPVGLTLNNGDQLYISDAGNNRIQEAAYTGHTEWGISMTINHVYTIAGSSSGTAGYSGDGGSATAALLNGTLSNSVTVSGGNPTMYVLDTNNQRIRVVNSAGTISAYAGTGYTLAQAGNGGPALTAGLNKPEGEAFDASGDVFIADSASNRVQEIAATTHTQYGISMTAGDVYTVDGSAAGTAGTTAALLKDPEGLVIDSSGNLYIDDAGNNRVQKLASSGTVTTFAGSSTGASGYTGDSGAATAATLHGPSGLALDSHGDLYIADASNNAVREVFASGGQNFGQSMTAGDIYTIAGTGVAGSGADGILATSSQLSGPVGVGVDGAGNLYIADRGNNRIREVPVATGIQRGLSMAANDVYTIAGGALGTSTDGSAAVGAGLNAPNSATVDAAGNVYIADQLNNRIEEVPVANGTQWGISMAAGDIYTVAGSATGAVGNSGDGGPAAAALIDHPNNVSLDLAGDMYVTDNVNSRLREVVSADAPTLPPAPGMTTALGIAPDSTATTVQNWTAPTGITISQPGGAEVMFYPEVGGSCGPTYVLAGQYCTLRENDGASLTSSGGTYTYTPQPGTTYTYNTGGNLTSITDSASDTLNVAYNGVPGSGNCPAAAAWCQVITAANGRTLTIGYNTANRVTSATDPLGRRWSYGYTGSDLTSVTDPMTPTANVTSYTYGAGSSGSPLNANNILTITEPNGQTGGPNAGAHTTFAYDSSGRVTSQTDPMGYATSYDWSAFNAATGNGVITVTDPDANKTVYYYSQGTLAAQSAWTATTNGTTLTSEQDYVPDQAVTTNTTTVDNSAGTQLDTGSADGNGSIVTTSYDGAGNPATITSPDGVGSQTTTLTEQSTSLNLPNCTSAAIAASTCSASPGPSPVTHGGIITPPSPIPPQGITWTLYDNYGNELYTTMGVYPPGGGAASYARSTYQLFKNNSITLNGTNITCNATPPSPSLPCATINANGVVTQLAYNSAGDVTSSSTPDGNGSELATTTYAYDGDGEQTSTTSPDGNLIGANAANYTAATTYNSDGQKTSVTQGSGTGLTVTPRTTNYGYDPNGNQTTVQDARGYTTTTTYNADSQATLVTDPDNNAVLTCYDGDGNVAQTVPPTGVAADGLAPGSCPTNYPSAYQSAPLAFDATMYTFDGNGNKTQMTTPAPAGQSGFETTSYTYDNNGNLIKTTAPPTSSGGANQVTVDTYNAVQQLTSVTTGYGTSATSTVSYCYDPNSDKTAAVYADGNISGIAPCETSSPWVVSSGAYPTQAAYQTTYGYDSVGELVSTTTPATATAPSGATTTSSYDAAGNMLTRTDPNGVTTTWTYTPANKAATENYSGSSAHSVTYGYDANGNKTGMTDGSGTSSYNYDPFGELISTTNGAGQPINYGYNADGISTSITYPLPSSATWATTSTVTYGYDHAGLLNSITDFNGHQISIGSTADGNPNSVTLGASGDTINTTYDGTDAPSAITLKSGAALLQSFTYSDAPAGTVLTETDVPSSAQSPASYTYDAQGRLTSFTPGSNPATSYSYDASSSLTGLPNGAAGSYDKAGELTGGSTAYTYNADGQRLTAKQGSTTLSSGTWNGAGQLTSYAGPSSTMSSATYDGDGNRAGDTTSTGSQAFVWSNANLLQDGNNAYIYAGQSTAPIEQVNLSNGNENFMMTDALGSVRGVVDSGGALIGTASYDAWGNPETAGGLASITPFGYAGGYTDPTGLIYLLARYYDPQTGQFISVDSLLGQSNEPYSYANNDPVINTDPTGNYWQVIWHTFAGGYVGAWHHCHYVDYRYGVGDPYCAIEHATATNWISGSLTVGFQYASATLGFSVTRSFGVTDGEYFGKILARWKHPVGWMEWALTWYTYELYQREWACHYGKGYGWCVKTNHYATAWVHRYAGGQVYRFASCGYLPKKGQVC